MDFADWCEHVLNKIIDARRSPEALRIGYLTDDALAIELLGSNMSDQFIGSRQRERLHSSLDELVSNGFVVKKKLGQTYRIDMTQAGQTMSKNLRAIRKGIISTRLSPDAEKLLRLVNGLSQKTDPHMVWVEEVKRDYFPNHGWSDKDKRIQAVRELEHYGLVRAHPPMGSEVDLTATFKSIVWQTGKDANKPTEPEIGHVLFTDIVGYSKQPMDTQTQLRAALKEIVRSIEVYRNAVDDQTIIRRSTGDGMALVFFGDPAGPVHCAVEISRVLRNRTDLKLRMGIHSGPIRRDEDINDELDVAGGGINYAQRVMDAGDAGHILISNAVAENLEQLGGWSNSLHDLGEIIAKHDKRIHVFNLWGDGFGNPALPESLGRATKPTTSPSAGSLTHEANVRLALVREIDANVEMLREIWDSVLARVTFRDGHNIARVQKNDAIRAINLPKWRREKWDQLFSQAISLLTPEEFEKVDSFYSRLERLTQTRTGDPKRWRIKAELIISDLVAEKNPLRK